MNKLLLSSIGLLPLFNSTDSENLINPDKQNKSGKPNILIILTNDQRADALCCL